LNLYSLGVRIKLHFDGYPTIYDFWTNYDNPDMFYANWCHENGRTLQPPKNYTKEFDWTVYIKETHAYPTTKAYFASTLNLAVSLI